MIGVHYTCAVILRGSVLCTCNTCIFLQCGAVLTWYFFPNPHNIHPIARSLGRGMGCILWVQTVVYTLPQSLQWCMQCHVILDDDDEDEDYDDDDDDNAPVVVVAAAAAAAADSVHWRKYMPLGLNDLNIHMILSKEFQYVETIQKYEKFWNTWIRLLYFMCCGVSFEKYVVAWPMILPM